MARISDYDPSLPQWREDPYPHYRALRDQAPVHYAEQIGVWCVSRYDDVMFVLDHPDLFSSRAMFTFLLNQGNEGTPPISWAMLRFMATLLWKTHLNPFEYATARNLISEDGERHRAMRNIVNRGFTPRSIAEWEPRAREIAAEAVESLGERNAFDLVECLSVPLPVTLISEMLGVEPERQSDFRRWSGVIVEWIGPGRSDPFRPVFRDTLIELTTYVQGIVRQRKLQPRDDLVSLIVVEQEGDTALSVREVVQFVMLLLVAGNETTTNLIGNTVRALLENRDELDRLVEQPELIPGAIEEGLRFDGPAQLVLRTTTQDVKIAGTTIPKGAVVAPLLGSANRDERHFEDPDRFDVTRNPQGHVGFGFSKHFCLGASLARLEARVALEALVPELPQLVLTATPELVDSFLIRGPQRLDLKWVAQPRRVRDPIGGAP